MYVHTIHVFVRLSLGETGENIITLIIIFTCTPGVPDSNMEVVQSTDSSYQYRVESPHGCIKEPKKKDQGLSGGSILCIIFVVLVFVYLVGGKMDLF